MLSMGNKSGSSLLGLNSIPQMLPCFPWDMITTTTLSVTWSFGCEENLISAWSMACEEGENHCQTSCPGVQTSMWVQLLFDLCLYKYLCCEVSVFDHLVTQVREQFLHVFFILPGSISVLFFIPEVYVGYKEGHAVFHTILGHCVHLRNKFEGKDTGLLP